MLLRFLYRFQREALSIFIRLQRGPSLYLLRFHKELPRNSFGFPLISKGIPSNFLGFPEGNLKDIEGDSLRALRGMQGKSTWVHFTIYLEIEEMSLGNLFRHEGEFISKSE